MARGNIHVFDTSHPDVAASTDTLNGAIDNSVTAITLHGTTSVSGTQIQIGSERMLVLSGGGTTSLTVIRGYGGTTPASHVDGATVNIPGYINSNLWAISSVRNRKFTFAKLTNDINFVQLNPNGSDGFLGGGDVIILADDSPERGVSKLEAPGVGSLWIPATGAGAAGAAGAEGAAGSGGITYGTLATLSIAEPSGARILYPDASTHTTVRSTLSITGGSTQQNVTLFLSHDGGTTWSWYGVYPFIVGLTPSLDLDYLIRTIADCGGLTSNNMQVYALAGSVPGSFIPVATVSLPAGGMFSNKITILLSPPNNSTLSAQLLNDAGGSDLSSTAIYQGINSNNNPCAGVIVSVAAPSTVDKNCKNYVITVDWVNASGVEGNPGGVDNPAGERPFTDFPNNGTPFQSRSDPWINYPAPGSPYNRLRFKIYGINRDNMASPPYTALDGTATLMACWPGGATSVLLPILLPGVNTVTAGDASTLSSSNPNYRPRTAETTGSQHVPIYFNPDLNSFPQTVSVFVDEGDGQGIRWWETFTDSEATTHFIDMLAPTASSQTVTIWCAPGPYSNPTYVPGVTLPSGAISCTPFSVAGVGVCASSTIQSAQLIADGTGQILEYVQDGNGQWLWSPYLIQWSIPGTNEDINFWTSILTIQKGAVISGVWTPAPDKEGKNEDPNGNYIGTQVIQADIPIDPNNPNATVPRTNVQYFGDNPPDWTYPPNINPDGSANLYRTYRFRLYAASRLGTSAAGGIGTLTLENCWPSAADHFDVTIAAHPATTDMGLAHPHTLGSGVQVSAAKLALKYGAALNDDGLGAATVRISGPVYVDLANNINIKLTSDLAVDGTGHLTVHAVNLASAYGFDTSIFTTSGGTALTVSGLAVNKLLVGDALFIGTATFASSGGGKVTLQSGGMTLGDNNVTPTTTAVFTSSSLTLSKVGTAVQLQLTASGVSIFGPVGSVTVTSGGIVITDSTNSITVNSSHVVIAGPSGSLTADSTGILITNGTSQVKVEATGVTITNGILNSPTITVSGGSFTVNIDTTHAITVTDSVAKATILGAIFQATNLSNASITAWMDTTAVYGGRVVVSSPTGVQIAMVALKLPSAPLPSGDPDGYIQWLVGGSWVNIPYYFP